MHDFLFARYSPNHFDVHNSPVMEALFIPGSEMRKWRQRGPDTNLELYELVTQLGLGKSVSLITLPLALKEYKKR